MKKINNNNFSNFIFYSLSVLAAVIFFILSFHFQNECIRLESETNSIKGKKVMELAHLKHELKDLEKKYKENIDKKISAYKKRYSTNSNIEIETVYWKK